MLGYLGSYSDTLYIYLAAVGILHSRKLTWKPNEGPKKTTVLPNGAYMGFHVSLGEWSPCGITLNP